MSRAEGQPRQSRAWAGLDERPERRSLLIARRSGPRWEIVQARPVSDTELPGLAAMLREAGVETLVRLVPAGEAVSKCVQAPVTDASDAQLAATAGLLAEAE